MYQQLYDAYFEEGLRLRRDLHKIPEEGLKETKTSAYVKSYLESLGLTWEPSAHTGLTCFFDAGADDTIAFRTDMDALCLEEENDVDYKSAHPGMMHACGHDAHMSIVLLLANYLSTHREQLKKNILLIFQPAEEGPGGAELMVKEGILEKYNVKCCFGLHVEPGYPQGSVAGKSGKLYASTTELYITIHGKGAHGAHPQDGNDAIITMTQLINAFQTIVSRNVDPIEEGLITIGKINAGERLNIIAKEARLEGTMRTHSPEIRELIVRRIANVIKGLEIAYECKIDLEFRYMYPALHNDHELFELIKPAFGDRFVPAVITMGAEDFSFFAEKVPSVYFQVGIGNEEKGFLHPAHSSRFNLDEEAIIVGLETDIHVLKTLGAL